MIGDVKQTFRGKAVHTMLFRYVEVVSEQTEMTVEEIESKLNMKQGTLKITGSKR